LSSAPRIGRGRARGRIWKGATTVRLRSRRFWPAWPAASPIPISIGTEPDADQIAALRAAEGIGRPLGSEAFVERVAALTGRNPRRGKPKRGAAAKELGIKRVSPKTPIVGMDLDMDAGRITGLVAGRSVVHPLCRKEAERGDL
jgi:hypothetical protein